MAPLNGFLLVDKEMEWTSSDVVAKLRGVLKQKSVGHAGTLDPNATGLLIVMVGKSTKASDYIMHKDKEYVCTLKLGVTTDTQDIWGTVLNTCDVKCTRDDLEHTLTKFTGDLEQIPPMYSAIKIHGQKLYDIARRGKEVERKPRPIHIYSLELLSWSGDELVLKIRCSSGTYIRTLCHDIGQSLGCGGCMKELRRTKIGNLSVEDAHKIGEIQDGSYLLSPEPFLEDVPEKVKNKILSEI